MRYIRLRSWAYNTAAPLGCSPRRNEWRLILEPGADNMAVVCSSGECQVQQGTGGHAFIKVHGLLGGVLSFHIFTTQIRGE